MGIFGKKKDEFEHLHNDNLLIDDDDLVFQKPKKQIGHAVGNGNVVAPHALTANEVLNTPTEEIPMDSRAQPDSVYKMMKEREQRNAETAIADDYVPSWAGNIKDTADEKQPEAKTVPVMEDVSSKKKEADRPKTADTVKSAEPTVTAPKVTVPETVTATEHSAAGDSFLERCRMALEKAADDDVPSESTVPETVKATADTSDKIPEKEPETHSVDDIVRMLRGNSHSDGNDKPLKPADTSGFETDADLQSVPDKTVIAPVDNDSDGSASKGREIKVEVEIIPTDSDSDIMHTDVSTPEPDSDVRVYGKIVNGSVIQQTADGDDIEATQFIKAIHTAKADDTVVADGQTVMISDIGDLGDAISRRAEDDVDSADDFDDDDDDDYYEDQPYYESEDPELQGIEDYKTLDDAATFRVKLMNDRSKNKTVASFTSAAAVIALAVAVLPLSAVPAATVSLIELILLVSALIMNYDLFLDFKNLFRMRPKFDSCVAIASTVALAQGIVSYLSDGGVMTLCAAATVLIAVNRIAKFMKAKRILHGLELIANSEPKRAVVSVGGSNAKVISSGSVDGEALVLCDRKVINVQNYIKNCSYDSPFERKIKPLLFVGAALSLAAGILIGYFTSAGVGLSVATAILLCIWPASAAFICELPMYLADRKSARYGAMIAGYKGAYELNNANLVAVNSHDLFPDGSVKLYNMKTLGENEIGKTLLDAAAVAIAANSPLANIFREIIGSGFEKDMPKVGGVQYEDKMGISGWIGERTVLIGNRNLMQGHSVTVPSAAVDQKILKAGYFPVYIAVSGVPCLLFLVKYEPDLTVAHELQTLCSTGMTVVVDPNDPNTSQDMLCDYFGLPSDALKVMNHNGRVSYERSTADIESASAPAVFGKNICGLFASVTSAINLNAVYSLLTAVMIIAAVLGSGLTIYLAVVSKLSLLTSLTLGGFQVLFAAIAALIARIKIHK